MRTAWFCSEITWEPARTLPSLPAKLARIRMQPAPSLLLAATLPLTTSFPAAQLLRKSTALALARVSFPPWAFIPSSIASLPNRRRTPIDWRFLQPEPRPPIQSTLYARYSNAQVMFGVRAEARVDSADE